MNSALGKMLRRWAKRRHPKKSKTWIEKKYFTTIGGNHWVFYGEVDGRTYYLVDTTSIPIKRHVKVQGKANPYDPEWESY
jgi:RNA-directed DNA polymerase